VVRNPDKQIHSYIGKSPWYCRDGMVNIIASPRQIFDTELLCTGALAPLNGFLKEKDYNSVVKE